MWKCLWPLCAHVYSPGEFTYVYAGVMGAKRPLSPGPALGAPDLGHPFLFQGVAAPTAHPWTHPSWSLSQPLFPLLEAREEGGGTVGIQMEF